MRVEQEDDLLAGRFITATAFAAAALAVALSGWAYMVLRDSQLERRPSAVFPERRLPEPTEVSGIEQEAFVISNQAERTANTARKRLHSYGWADRERRTVHVPIDRAIELYVAQEGAR